jgi:hypothetical protein
VDDGVQVDAAHQTGKLAVLSLGVHVAAGQQLAFQDDLGVGEPLHGDALAWHQLDRLLA